METQISKEAVAKLEIVEGQLVAEVKQVGTDGEASIVVKIKIENVLNIIKEKIPGHFDDAIIDGAKLLLLKA